MCDQQSLRSACAHAQSDQSLCLSLKYPLSVKLLTEHHLRFLSLIGGCTGSSESTLVKMPHCWKSHVMAHLCEDEIEKAILRDPRDGFFYPTLTLMSDSYIVSSQINILCQDLVLKSTPSNIEIIFVTISRSNCFGYSKEPSP